MTQYTFERLRPEYEALWAAMKVTKTAAADAQATRIIANKARYLEVQRRTSVPWFVVGCLHMRESSGNFSTYLGNGQPLNRVTTIVPKGRGPWASFEDGAEDALAIDGTDQIRQWSPARVAYACEKFNGFGYRHPNRNIPSPYLWGGTTVQQTGKFIRDGVYDPNVMDPQLGAMAVLRQLLIMDKTARFERRVDPPVPKADPVEPQSPKAEDTEGGVKPIQKSKTVWGGILQSLSGVAAAVAAFIQGMPPWLIALIVVALLVGLFLVVKGRIDIQKVVQHLSNDDKGE